MRYIIYFILTILLPVFLQAQVGVYSHKASYTKSEALFMMEELGGDTLLTSNSFLAKREDGTTFRGIALRKLNRNMEIIEENKYMSDSLSISLEYLIPSIDTGYFIVFGRGFRSIDSANNKHYFVSMRIDRSLNIERVNIIELASIFAQIGFSGHRINDTMIVAMSYDNHPLTAKLKAYHIYLLDQYAQVVKHKRYLLSRGERPILDVMPDPETGGFVGFSDYLHLYDENLEFLGEDPSRGNYLFLSGQCHVIRDAADSSILGAGSKAALAVRMIVADKGFNIQRDTNLRFGPDTLGIVAGGRAIDMKPGKEVFCVGGGYLGKSSKLPLKGLMLMQVDKSLDVRWVRYFNFEDRFNGKLSLQPYDVLATRDGGCICGGFLNVYQGSSTGYSVLMRVDSLGQIVSSRMLPPLKYDISIYPNPSPGHLHIHIEAGSSKMKIQIIDIMGKMILEQDVRSGLQDLDLTAIPNGFYVYRIVDDLGQTIASGKWERR